MQLSSLKLDTSFMQAAKVSLISLGSSIVNLLLGKQAHIKDHKALVGLLLVVLSGRIYYWNKYSFWSRRNARGPSPLPFFGNFIPFMTRPRPAVELEWIKKYGKVFGYYMGVKPYLAVADAAVLKRICIKDFDRFQNRYVVDVKNKYQNHFVLLQEGDHWKGMRSVLSPTFSSGKIKHMYKILNACVDDLILAHYERIKDKGEARMDVRAVMGAFSMGAGLSSFYGVNLEREKTDNIDPNAPTKENFARRSARATQTPFRYVASHLLPTLMKLLNIPLVPEQNSEFFERQAKMIIKRRLETGQRTNDYLQLLIEAKSDDSFDKAETDAREEHHALGIADGSKTMTGEVRKIKLTPNEVSCQVMLFMTVATETTANLLSNTIYLLAYHPEIQQKLVQEILKIAKDDYVSRFSFDYETLTSCEYLDCVISESLRVMSPVITMDRMANEHYYIEDYNIHIPEGQVVSLCFNAIMKDPDYWPNPDRFDPERFRPHNRHKIVPGSYCPFGIGPRSCLAYRFSLTQAKVALARVLCEFEYAPAPGTKFPPDSKTPSFILNDRMNLEVTFHERP